MGRRATRWAGRASTASSRTCATPGGHQERGLSRVHDAVHVRDECPRCQGKRLRPESLAVTVADRRRIRRRRRTRRSRSRPRTRARMRRLRTLRRSRWSARCWARGRCSSAGATADRRPAAARDHRAAGVSERRGAGLSLAGPQRGDLSGGEGSASGWRRRSARGCAACCMCSTSPPSGCTSATTSG
jgi:hypothetical protein